MNTEALRSLLAELSNRRAADRANEDAIVKQQRDAEDAARAAQRHAEDQALAEQVSALASLPQTAAA